MQTISFITSNGLKSQEVKAILGHSTPFKLLHHALELPELQASPDEISINKCLTAASLVQGAVLVEDTTLTFNSLNGLPGPYIKSFLAQIGLEGLYRILLDFEDKSATVTSTFAYTEGIHQPVQLFTGTMHGTIVHPGNHVSQTHWGYIFQPDDYLGNYAVMDQYEKNKISHRYKALMLLKAHFYNSSH